LWAWGRVCQTGYCGLGGECQTGYCGRGVEFVKHVIVGLGESLSNWLFWAWGRVCQTGYCVSGAEYDKLVSVVVG
jgi:hypothetical protein